VSPGRRAVRTPEEFYLALDGQLGPERGPGGRPSRRDFDVHELLKIVEYVAENFDAMPEEIPGRAEYRRLIISGRLVPRIAVLAQLAADGAVDLIDIDLDFNSPWNENDDEPEDTDA
jgi:hypothetical protein